MRTWPAWVVPSMSLWPVVRPFTSLINIFMTYPANTCLINRERLSCDIAFVLCADVMYIEDLVKPLIASLTALSHKGSDIFMAHGRNRQAEDTFLKACTGSFAHTDVPESELHRVYQCSDVRVLKLRKLTA